MNKRLDELRDKLADEYAIRAKGNADLVRRTGFKNGFNAAISELIPRVERLTACIQELHDQCGYASPWQIRMSKELTEWREFMGEG